MRRGVSLVGLALIAVVGSACSPVSFGRAMLGLSNPKPNPYQAAVRQVWNLNNKMNMTLDSSLPDRYETGNAVLGDRAYIAGRKQQGVGPEVTAALPLKSSQVWVPPQKGYPAHFLALVNSYEVRQGVPDRTTPSTGIFSPGRTTSSSATCTCSMGNSRSCPARIT